MKKFLFPETFIFILAISAFLLAPYLVLAEDTTGESATTEESGTGENCVCPTTSLGEVSGRAATLRECCQTVCNASGEVGTTTQVTFEGKTGPCKCSVEPQCEQMWGQGATCQGLVWERGSVTPGWCDISAETLRTPPPPPLPEYYKSTPPILEIPVPGQLTNFSPAQIYGEPGSRYFYIPWIGEYVGAIYKYTLGIVGILATVVLIWAGIVWLTAAGNAEKIKLAQEYMSGAIIGLALAFGSYLILYTLNPDLVNFAALKLKVIERVELGPVEGCAGACPQVTPLDCNDPNTIITWEKFNNVDLNLFPDKVREYKINTSLIPQYKAAAGRVPWEMLAVLHKREGGGQLDTSVLNGSALCNNNDNSSCLACGCPGPNCGKPDNPLATRENDLKCGVELILKKAGRVGGTLTHSEADFETIKKAFGRYAGGASGCYDATYHMTTFFDEYHANMWKAGLDCICMQGNCNPNCVTDATLSPRNPRGCCTIKVYKRGKAPSGFDPRGSFCNNVQRSECKIAEDDSTATYQYKSCVTIEEDPCGALQRQDRPGVFTMYAWLKKEQALGQIPY